MTPTLTIPKVISKCVKWFVFFFCIFNLWPSIMTFVNESCNTQLISLIFLTEFYYTIIYIYYNLTFFNRDSYLCWVSFIFISHKYANSGCFGSFFLSVCTITNAPVTKMHLCTKEVCDPRTIIIINNNATAFIIILKLFAFYNGRVQTSRQSYK